MPGAEAPVAPLLLMGPVTQALHMPPDAKTAPAREGIATPPIVMAKSARDSPREGEKQQIRQQDEADEAGRFYLRSDRARAGREGAGRGAHGTGAEAARNACAASVQRPRCQTTSQRIAAR